MGFCIVAVSMVRLCVVGSMVVGIPVVVFSDVFDKAAGWNVVLIVGFWGVGARDGEKDGFFDGVLVGCVEVGAIVGENEGLFGRVLVGCLEVGASVRKKEGLLDGVLVGSLEGVNDGIQLGLGIRVGISEELSEGAGVGVASPLPRTTIAIAPNAHNPMTSTIPKHNRLPPGVRVSGMQLMSVFCGTSSSSTMRAVII